MSICMNDKKFVQMETAVSICMNYMKFDQMEAAVSICMNDMKFDQNNLVNETLSYPSTPPD